MNDHRSFHSFVWWILALVLIAPIVFALATPATAKAEESRTVCETCEFRSIVDALADAPPGARIEVHGGVYPGGIVIDRPVELVGIGGPIIDNGGHGTVIHITAPNVSIEGFTVRGTGASLDHEDTGILVESGPATIRNNLVEDALFGIYVKNAVGTQVVGNEVTGKDLPIARRGDGIRVWYTNDILIEGNTVRNGRDVIIWYSDRAVIRDNFFNGGRYGLHLMFNNQPLIEGNSLQENSIGLYIMYSHDVTVVGNTLANNRTAGGQGMGFKDIDNASIIGNRFVNNSIGAQIDNSPSEVDAQNLYRGNVFAFNEIGLALLPNVRQNTFTENTFSDNIQNVSILGGGKLKNNNWSSDGIGNFWSDYAGYDANRDGIGDIPYRSQRLFESLTDDNKELRLFLYSPAEMAIDFSAKAFPLFRPALKLEDNAPLMRPVVAPELPAAETMETFRRFLTGFFGLAIGSLALGMVINVRRRKSLELDPEPESIAITSPNGIPQEMKQERKSIVTVNNLTKRYGDTKAIDEISFSITSGESIALWGPNGAGKTTILRCLLGIARFSGDVEVGGFRSDKDGRQARSIIGYVPQELAAPELTVGEMTEFIARLKHVNYDDAFFRLEQLRIADQADKQISALSGGMKQRLALALALIGDPQILLLDEPTANLDARGRGELIELLKELKQQNMTLIFSSHRPEDVLLLADRILIIEQGKLATETNPNQFLADLGAHTHLVVYLTEASVDGAQLELEQLGYQVVKIGSTLSVPVDMQQKAQVIGTLISKGYVVEDFELERGTWISQS